MDFAVQFYMLAEYLGTVAFAASGAMLAIDARLDVFGVLFIGGVTALGGGTLRDLMLGISPPKMFYSYQFLLIAALVALIVFVCARVARTQYNSTRNQLERVFNVFDSIGLAAFAVTGVQAGMQAGYAANGFLCVFLGMTTCIGGGILRDILIHNVPIVLRKYVYATAAIAGSLIFYLLCRAGVPSPMGTLISMSVTVSIRLLATHYRWNLPSA